MDRRVRRVALLDQKLYVPIAAVQEPNGVGYMEGT